MIVFAIEREKYLDKTLEGIGPSKSEDCRWNSQNTKIAYTAESRALAILEVSVHLDLEEDLPNDHYFIEIEIPDEIMIQEVKLEDLPDGWDSKPPIDITQSIGDDFIKKNEAAILKVPSSIVHQEFNFLINPKHPDFLKVKVLSTYKMDFDPRLNSKN
jgi:RES domain-containing protein